MEIRSKTCPVCATGTLVEKVYDREETIDSHSHVIRGLLYSICNHCNERVTTPDQSRHNKRIIIESRGRAVTARDLEQKLEPAGILRIRKKLGLTQAQASRVFGGGANAFSKYENGEVEPSEGMEKLLCLSDSLPVAASWLLQRAGLPTEFSQDHQRSLSNSGKADQKHVSPKQPHGKLTEHQRLELKRYEQLNFNKRLYFFRDEDGEVRTVSSTRGLRRRRALPPQSMQSQIAELLAEYEELILIGSPRIDADVFNKMFQQLSKLISTQKKKLLALGQVDTDKMQLAGRRSKS